MIRSAIALLASAAMLSACVTPVTPDDTDTAIAPPGHETIRFDGERATRAERVACESAGGTVGPGGLLGFDQCVQPYVDAGAACKSSDDCLGRCLLSPDSDADVDQTTDDGICQATDSLFGCMTEVDEGIAQWTICFD